MVGASANDKIINCYSTCKISVISAIRNVGGLVGVIIDGAVLNSCLWDVNSSNWTTSAAGIGKTTAEMQTLSTFTDAGWDFSYTDGDDEIWYMFPNKYPVFTWQISPVDINLDGQNNFSDFAVLAKYWMRQDCEVYNDYCDFADLDFNHSVDIDDLAIFLTHWLDDGIYD
jgi:hypothetical protein